MNTIRKIVLGTALAATSLAVAAPASAQDYQRYHRGGDSTGAAIVGGVIGLALGAAIASSSHHHHRYYNQGYQYRDRRYDRRGYYQQSWNGGDRDRDDDRDGDRYDNRGQYDNGYYGNGYSNGYYNNGYSNGGYYGRGY